jgi:hypothetical protein
MWTCSGKSRRCIAAMLGAAVIRLDAPLRDSQKRIFPNARDSGSKVLFMRNGPAMKYFSPL